MFANIEEAKKIIANNIRRYRKFSNLTQKELADRINLAMGTDLKNNTISSWESAVNSVDNVYIPVIADILGITINEIYGMDNSPTTIAAHADHDLSEEEQEKVREYIKFLEAQRK